MVKLTHLSKYIVPGLAILLAFLFVRDCGLSRDYKRAKLEYEGYKAIAEADHKIQQGIIEDAQAKIAAQTKTISLMTTAISQKEQAISGLSKRLDILQSQEPVAPELESMPLVINLREQIKVLSEEFSLARSVIADQKKVIEAWEIKFGEQVTISETWKKEYESEHALRLTADNLIKKLEYRFHWNNKLKTAAVIVAVGAVVYGLAK